MYSHFSKAWTKPSCKFKPTRTQKFVENSFAFTVRFTNPVDLNTALPQHDYLLNRTLTAAITTSTHIIKSLATDTRESVPLSA